MKFGPESRPTGRLLGISQWRQWAIYACLKGHPPPGVRAFPDVFAGTAFLAAMVPSDLAGIILARDHIEDGGPLWVGGLDF